MITLERLREIVVYNPTFTRTADPEPFVHWLRLTKIEAENFEVISLTDEEQKEEEIEAVVVNKQITFVPMNPPRMRRL